MNILATINKEFPALLRKCVEEWILDCAHPYSLFGECATEVGFFTISNLAWSRA